MSPFLIVASPLAFIGNCVFWVSIWNHVNGSGLSRRWIKLFSRISFVACGVLPLLFVASLLANQIPRAAAVYFGFCFTITVVTLPWEWTRRRRAVRNNHVIEETSTVHHFSEHQRRSVNEASPLRRVMLASGLNQAFEIDESVKQIELENLPSALDGLTIAHISDVHFTGDVRQGWFDAAVDIVNGMNADIVAITGDLVDNPACNQWLKPTLGRLTARHGVYFVLGNHDGKQDRVALRKIMTDCGFDDLSGCYRQLRINGHEVLLAGDETPWGPGLLANDQLPQTNQQTRVLLAHSPDSIELARDANFDLMLAGHTHGGQFCIPGFGPVVCPMQRSLELATGTIYRQPTVLHVSRGLSGELPLRIHCRPEVTCLVLRSGQELEGPARAAAPSHQRSGAMLPLGAGHYE